jgi:hypothetical protein
MDLNAAATAIGIPVTQLQQELATKSLADVATSHGKSAVDVANALKNAAHARPAAIHRSSSRSMLLVSWRIGELRPALLFKPDGRLRVFTRAALMGF